MSFDDLRRIRRTLRRTLRWRAWTLHKKISVAVWIPVVVVAFALFTGPNRVSTAAPARTTTTTFPESSFDASPTPGPNAMQSAPSGQSIAWVKAVPPRKTFPQLIAVQRFRAQRQRLILAQQHTVQTLRRNALSSAQKKTTR